MSRIKHAVKGALGWTLFRSGAGPRLLSDRAVVIAFHRIDDRYRGDPITVGRDDFLRFLDYFQRHFDVVPLGRVLELLAAGGSLGGKLAITFDDGYRDNATFAAPELARRGLPATFFIATGFVGSDRSAWWDEERGIRSEWMSWDEAREMARLGMSLAPHTVSHPDMATLDREAARRELLESVAALEREVGEVAPDFAYPFGGPEHMAAPALDAVRDAGLRCCCSCFGGTVHAGDDPLRLERTPINDWYASTHQFGMEVALDVSRRRRSPT